MKMLNIFFVFISFIFTLNVSANERLKMLNGLPWSHTAFQANVDKKIVYALALKESGSEFENSFTAHPWAIGVGVNKAMGHLKHTGIYPESKAEAEEVLSRLVSEGYTNLGVGMMQISLLYHRDKVENIKDLLDPAINLSVAAKIINDCKQMYTSIRATLACYSYGEGDDPLGLDYADEALVYAEKYSTVFFKDNYLKQPVGELGEEYLAMLWAKLDTK